MRRLWKPLLGLVVVVAAFTISFGLARRKRPSQIDIDTSPRARAARQKTPLGPDEAAGHESGDSRGEQRLRRPEPHRPSADDAGRPQRDSARHRARSSSTTKMAPRPSRSRSTAMRASSSSRTCRAPGSSRPFSRGVRVSSGGAARRGRHRASRRRVRRDQRHAQDPRPPHRAALRPRSTRRCGRARAGSLAASAS